MSTTLIDLQIEAAITTITLNRPDKRNAMSDAMRTKFIDALERVAADKAIKALVLTGAGSSVCTTRKPCCTPCLARGCRRQRRSVRSGSGHRTGLYFLPRRVGLARAKELIFTGRKVDVDEAVKLGIVDRKTAGHTLVADAQAWACELGQASATALALTKTILNQSFELSAHDVFAQGSQAQGICYTSTEHRESVMAFLAKSAPAARD